jgi:hypothetical protein
MPETERDPLDLYTDDDVRYAVVAAGQLVYDSDERLEWLVQETARILAREMTKVDDLVADDGANATLTVSGQEVRCRIQPRSAFRLH